MKEGNETMRRILCVVLMVLSVVAFTTSCKKKKKKGLTPEPVVQKVDNFTPNLPSVPIVPPPPFPITYGDGTYSVSGARRKINQLVNSEISVTGYIVDQYKPPECPKGEVCPPPSMPHLWLADDLTEKNPNRWLTVVGYGGSQQAIDDERERIRLGKPLEVIPGTYPTPIVYDWMTGQKYTIKGNFTRSSGTGFLRSDGLLEYTGHQCLDCPPPPPLEEMKKATPKGKAGEKPSKKPVEKGYHL